MGAAVALVAIGYDDVEPDVPIVVNVVLLLWLLFLLWLLLLLW